MPGRLHRSLLVCASAVLALASAVAPSPGWALIIDAGDGLGNTEAPDDLPEWSNVGRRAGGPSLVYLGNRWVLTANHVGAGTVVLGDEHFDPVAGTPTPILNDDGSPTDLLLFRLDHDPGLPALRLSRTPPRVGERVILVAMGSSRGDRLTIDSQREGLLDGFYWRPDGTKRWGTNQVSGPVRPLHHDDSYTLAIPSIFDRIDDPFGTRQEATAAEGDSGGALFAREDALRPERGFVLSGLLFSVSRLPEQPADTSLYGGVTYAADIASYRDRLIPVIRPACANERDDDGDGHTDYPDDTSCASAEDDDEGRHPFHPGPMARWLMGAVLIVLTWRAIMLWHTRGRWRPGSSE